MGWRIHVHEDDPSILSINDGGNDTLLRTSGGAVDNERAAAFVAAINERSTMSLTPRGDRITASPIKAAEQIGSIIIPEDARGETQRATVLAVGPATEVADLAAGDTIVYAKYGGTTIKDDDDNDVLILRDSDVIAKVA